MSWYLNKKVESSYFCDLTNNQKIAPELLPEYILKEIHKEWLSSYATYIGLESSDPKDIILHTPIEKLAEYLGIEYVSL